MIPARGRAECRAPVLGVWSALPDSGRLQVDKADMVAAAVRKGTESKTGACLGDPRRIAYIRRNARAQRPRHVIHLEPPTHCCPKSVLVAHASGAAEGGDGVEGVELACTCAAATVRLQCTCGALTWARTRPVFYDYDYAIAPKECSQEKLMLVGSCMYDKVLLSLSRSLALSLARARALSLSLSLSLSLYVSLSFARSLARSLARARARSLSLSVCLSVSLSLAQTPTDTQRDARTHARTYTRLPGALRRACAYLS